LGDCGTYEQCVPGVFNMRLAQEKPLLDDPLSAVTATYDRSCPFGVKTDACPFGSVHNVDKAPIGARVARQLRRLMGGENGQEIVAAGPRVTFVKARALEGGSKGTSEVVVEFKGGTPPFYQGGTQNCDRCCQWAVGSPPTNASSNDYDASGDGGVSWVNGSGAVLIAPGLTGVRFTVALEKVTHVRYTANQAFPQCAVFNREKLPALPFLAEVGAWV
jgi:hypothetical protein